MCVREKAYGRERERVCVCVCEWETVCVCVRVRDSVCVFIFVCEEENIFQSHYFARSLVLFHGLTIFVIFFKKLKKWISNGQIHKRAYFRLLIKKYAQTWRQSKLKWHLKHLLVEMYFLGQKKTFNGKNCSSNSNKIYVIRISLFFGLFETQSPFPCDIWL